PRAACRRLRGASTGRGRHSVTDRREKIRSQRRLFIFAGVIGLAALALIVQLVRLMLVVPGREGSQALVLPQVERGAILDRQGRILAVTTREQRVSAWVPGITNAAESAGLLAKTLGMDAAAILDAWNRREGYVVVKRRVTPDEAAAILRMKAEGKLAGVRVEDDFGRFYPQGRLASHVVGYVGADNVPWDGIEYTFNDDLAPQPVGTDTETVFGSQVFLTIDAGIEYMVEKIARAAFEANKPDSLTIMIMDARSGEFLAYASLPDFDPNEFQNDAPRVDKAALFNRPLAVSYEPGSVFKVFSLSSMLDLGAITPQSHFYTPGYYEKRLRGETIRIGDVGKHGDLTPREIVGYSSNSGAAYASDQTDGESLYRMLTRFGFGRPTGLPLLGETPGLLRKPSLWSGRSKATITIGQEISVSAVQLITAATALANGGVLLKPLIVKKIVSPDGKVIREYSREPLWEAISPTSASEMLSFMEFAASPEGTARRAAVPGIRISAKTGTAQVAMPSGGYSDKDFTASMLGIFPTEDPRFIVYVVMENPKGESYYGSTIAAPIFHDVAVGLLDSQGIPRTGTRTLRSPGSVEVPVPRQIEISTVMPNLIGMPKRLILPFLIRHDLAVTIKGSGYVVRQDPAPGTPIQSGMKITLELQ
ncbi:MAG TPA: penicillin-binding protein, partial [Spirochaetia bacterium]|nr:penicillin-binding protein [Spirochaetia bacterium]